MTAQRAAAALVLATIAVTGGALGDAGPGAGAPSPDRTCGVALGLFASDPAWDYGPMLTEIAAHGATDVMLSVPWVQDTLTSSDLGPRPGSSPDAATVARTLAQAHDRGLRVTLMPVVRLEERGDGRWRGALQPADRDAWFSAYSAHMTAHADLAQAAGVHRLVVGSELSSLEADDARWRALVSELRGRTDATLTWSANWDRFEQVPFWDALDEVGVSAWFEVGEGDADGWAGPQARLRAIAAATGKPVLLTEVGYPARATAGSRPWDHAGPATPAPRLQAALLDRFFVQFTDRPDVSGAFVWNWFGRGGTLDAGYSPRGRPAAAVLKRHFAQWCGAPA